MSVPMAGPVAAALSNNINKSKFDQLASYEVEWYSWAEFSYWKIPLDINLLSRRSFALKSHCSHVSSPTNRTRLHRWGLKSTYWGRAMQIELHSIIRMFVWVIRCETWIIIVIIRFLKLRIRILQNIDKRVQAYVNDGGPKVFLITLTEFG